MTHAFTASSLLEVVKARERGYDIYIQTWDDDICLSKAERERIPDRGLPNVTDCMVSYNIHYDHALV